MLRKIPLANGEVYHIFTRSIADYHIFNDASEFLRMIQLMRYYQFENELRFSEFLDYKLVQSFGFDSALKTITKDKKPIVQIIAYCLMPTHPHLILKQLNDNGITKYLSNILNGYTRYFNTKHKRKGPLWESEFKNVLVDSDEQLYHLSRYLHLNPVTARLVETPENWVFSSYREYISKANCAEICDFRDQMNIKPSSYKKFVNDQISYQRELDKIKHLILE